MYIYNASTRQLQTCGCWLMIGRLKKYRSTSGHTIGLYWIQLIIIRANNSKELGNWLDRGTGRKLGGLSGNNTKKSGSTIQAQCFSRPCWPPTITIIPKKKVNWSQNEIFTYCLIFQCIFDFVKLTTEKGNMFPKGEKQVLNNFFLGFRIG